MPTRRINIEHGGSFYRVVLSFIGGERRGGPTERDLLCLFERERQRHRQRALCGACQAAVLFPRVKDYCRVTVNQQAQALPIDSLCACVCVCVCVCVRNYACS